MRNEKQAFSLSLFLFFFLDKSFAKYLQINLRISLKEIIREIVKKITIIINQFTVKRS